MKKVGIIFLAIIFLGGFAGNVAAIPVPFQIGTGGYLDENVTDGIGLLAGQEALASGPFWLDEGQTSATIDFFKIWVPLALAEGTVDAYIDFLSPTPAGDVVSAGTFKVFSLVFLSAGELTWEEPELFPYSYNGSTGGLLQVNLFDIPKSWQRGACYTIKGTVTNVRSVPEPATIVLMGFGLVGLAGMGRKKLFKK